MNCPQRMTAVRDQWPTGNMMVVGKSWPVSKFTGERPAKFYLRATLIVAFFFTGGATLQGIVAIEAGGLVRSNEASNGK